LIYKQVFDRLKNQEVRMKIKVERESTPEGDLVFTVRVSDPHVVEITSYEKKIIHILEECLSTLDSEIHDSAEKVKEDVQSSLNGIKHQVFCRMIERLKFNVENDFRPKFKPICQEIYNWLYDYQTGETRQWMQEFDPQRTKYYFDNDINTHTCPGTQESEHDEDED